MGEKKRPGRFTIQFNLCDPKQKAVSDLLDQQGRSKAQFLTSAVLHYLNCPETPECRTPLPVDRESLEKLVLEILARNTAGQVIAVEIDTNLLPILTDTLKDYSNVKVINQDILKVDINELVKEYNNGRPIKVVANLPYYITTPIIMGLFESNVPIDNITVMVQKEVADRMQVGPGSKDYGALSLAVQYYASPYIVANVPPNCFIPRPNVGSAVIRLTRYQEPPVQVKDPKLMFKLIRASFNQRRKTLQNGLNNSPEISFSKEEITKAIESLGVSPSVRGEALSLEQFAQLANYFAQ